MKKLATILGTIIFSIMGLIVIVGLADAYFISSDLAKEELAFKSSVESYYIADESAAKAIESRNKARENAINNCAVLVALKKRDGLTVENENCGLDFMK